MTQQRALKHQTDTTSVPLIAGQRLVIQYHDRVNILNLFSSDGRVSLSVHVTADGPVLRIGADRLTIQSEGDLTIDAPHLSLNSRRGITLSTGGDIDMAADGEIRTKGRSQTIDADPGDVRITANDDVRIDGERIRMNC